MPHSCLRGSSACQVETYSRQSGKDSQGSLSPPCLTALLHWLYPVLLAISSRPPGPKARLVSPQLGTALGAGLKQCSVVEWVTAQSQLSRTEHRRGDGVAGGHPPEAQPWASGHLHAARVTFPHPAACASSSMRSTLATSPPSPDPSVLHTHPLPASARPHPRPLAFRPSVCGGQWHVPLLWGCLFYLPPWSVSLFLEVRDLTYLLYMIASKTKTSQYTVAV